MDVLPDTLERLANRVETLEQRVLALEASKTLEHTPSAVMREPAAPPAVVVGEGFSLAQAGGAFSVMGISMLGIAGAYLLRAVAESSSQPRLAIAAVAIVYALLWLVAAARVRDEEWFSSTIYAGTSALILAPMLKAHSIKEIITYLDKLSDPDQVADLVSCALLPGPHERQTILETIEIEPRLKHLIHFLMAEISQHRKNKAT